MEAFAMIVWAAVALVLTFVIALTIMRSIAPKPVPVSSVPKPVPVSSVPKPVPMSSAPKPADIARLDPSVRQVLMQLASTGTGPDGKKVSKTDLQLMIKLFSPEGQALFDAGGLETSLGDDIVIPISDYPIIYAFLSNVYKQKFPSAVPSVSPSPPRFQPPSPVLPYAPATAPPSGAPVPRPTGAPVPRPSTAAKPGACLEFTDPRLKMVQRCVRCGPGFRPMGRECIPTVLPSSKPFVAPPPAPISSTKPTGPWSAYSGKCTATGPWPKTKMACVTKEAARPPLWTSEMSPAAIYPPKRRCVPVPVDCNGPKANPEANLHVSKAACESACGNPPVYSAMPVR